MEQAGEDFWEKEDFLLKVGSWAERENKRGEVPEITQQGTGAGILRKLQKHKGCPRQGHN